MGRKLSFVAFWAFSLVTLVVFTHGMAYLAGWNSSECAAWTAVGGVAYLTARQGWR